MITWQQAITVLTVFANTARIQDVTVVGSFARSKTAYSAQGNDLDVVLVVDWQTYTDYLALMWQSVRKYGNREETSCYCGESEAPISGNEFFENAFKGTDHYYSDFRDHRFTAMLAMFPELKESGWFDFAIDQLDGHANIDIHLMPPGWQENIDATQRHLPHDDPSFVRNIAGDARTLRTVVGRNYRRVMGW